LEVKVLGKNDIKNAVEISKIIFNPSSKYLRYHKTKVWEEIMNHGGILLGALEDGKLIGFAFGHPKEENTFHYWMGGVLEEYRNRGLGTKLLEILEQVVLEKGFVSITVNTFQEKYPVQFELLKKHGYEIYKTENEIEDGVHMTKSYLSKKL